MRSFETSSVVHKFNIFFVLLTLMLVNGYFPNQSHYDWPVWMYWVVGSITSTELISSPLERASDSREKYSAMTW